VRVVLDTNVFISGIFFSGPPFEILEAWRQGRLTLVVSPPILDEYQRVGRRLAAKFAGLNIDPVLALVAMHAEIAAPPPLPGPVCSDASDDMFFACAVAARCPCIVSGDQHLLKASGYANVEVMRPRSFVDRHLLH